VAFGRVAQRGGKNSRAAYAPGALPQGLPGSSSRRQSLFCAQVNKAWGSTLVREVKFVAAKPGPRHISHELDNEHIPFIRRRKA
jgi:hypothetical protein